MKVESLDYIKFRIVGLEFELNQILKTIITVDEEILAWVRIVDLNVTTVTRRRSRIQHTFEYAFFELSHCKLTVIDLFKD